MGRVILEYRSVTYAVKLLTAIIKETIKKQKYTYTIGTIHYQ